MMITIYHNPRCRKSRETLALINDANKEVEIIEYLKEPPSTGELKKLLAKLNKSPEEILRKGETIFKEKFKGLKLTDEEWIEVMVENPKLIERPIVVRGNKALIGRPPENVQEFL